jgi:cytochrome P450
MSWLDISQNYEPYQAFKMSSAIVLLVTGLYALYMWLLPKPLPGIPFNIAASKSIWGDVLELRDDPSGLAKWCSKQLEAHGTPICQALMGPLSKPVVLVADIGNAREMLMGRSDFDRSVYIIDRFPLFGEFHLNMKTGDGWRQSRGWLKDLLAPQYLHNVAGPAIHSSILKLIKLWETKSHVANGKVFSMISDLKTLALDVIVAFHFGADFQDSALERQIQHIGQLDAKKLLSGQHNDVLFPKATLHEFQQGLTDVGDKMAAIYTTKFPPSIVSWWARYVSPYYRPFFEAKDRFIRKHIDLAVHRRRNNEDAKTGIDHMVYREAKAAQKARREPVFAKQIMIDEVRTVLSNF